LRKKELKEAESKAIKKIETIKKTAQKRKELPHIGTEKIIISSVSEQRH